MINFSAFLFLISGAAGVATTYFSRSFDSIRIELWLLVELLWIFIGVGLWRRKEIARILALAAFLVGCFSLVILLALTAFHLREAGSFVAAALGAVLIVTALAQSVSPFLAVAVPVVALLLAALIIGGSLLSFWAYGYFQRPQVVAQFGGAEAGTYRKKVYALAVAYAVLLPFCSAGFTLEQSSLPSLLQSRAYRSGQETRTKVEVEKRLSKLAGEALFSEDGGSLAIASNTTSRELFLIDTAKGTAVRKNLNTFDMYDLYEGDRLSSLLSADHRFFFRSSDRHLLDTRSGNARRLASPPGYVRAIGFGPAAATYIYFDPTRGRIEALDLAADRVLFSIDATRQIWFRNDLGNPRLSRALRAGAMSPDRRRYAYLFENRLHVADLAGGTLEIEERQMTDYGHVFFSKESDAVIVTLDPFTPTAGRGVVYSIADKTVREHSIPASVMYFSTREDRIVVHRRGFIAEYSLKDLANAQRKISIPEDGMQFVSPDARFFFIKRSGSLALEFADLLTSAAPAFAPLQTRLGDGVDVYPRLAFGKSHLALLSGPQVEIIAVSDLGQQAASQLVDLGKLAQEPGTPPAR